MPYGRGPHEKRLDRHFGNGKNGNRTESSRNFCKRNKIENGKMLTDIAKQKQTDFPSGRDTISSP